jgi:tetratricopeptide (TPR) repeat protein
VPVWHEKTRQAVANNQLVMLGVIQEQHADRCRLFAQWKGFDWPILQDAINLLGPKGVPIVVALDAAGVVRALNPQPDQFDDFLSSSDPVVAASDSKRPTRRELYEDTLATRPPSIGGTSNAASLCQYGDGLILWGTDKDLDATVVAYESAAKLTPEHGPTQFRLGSALRRRYESEYRQANDFQRAVAHWSLALELQPNQYIWRRRIQQYGPRMIKPYAFYDWVSQAQRDIRGRGEQPIELTVELTRAERAYPAKQAEFAASQGKEPDPHGEVQRDEGGVVQASATLVPQTATPGSTVRVYLELTPNAQRSVHWTNDAGPTTVWVVGDAGLSIEKPQIEASGKARAELSHETRAIEFEVKVPATAPRKETIIQAYALYYVCEGVKGQCVYRRQDVSIPVRLRDE